MEVGRQRRILIVDDEESLAWSLSSRLAKLRPGYDIATAYDGMSALLSLQANPADLLVADVRMPGMTGIDLVVIALQENPDLRVIVMTAFKAPEVDRLSESSSIKFLEKPFEFEHFLNLVDQSLSDAQLGFSGAISVKTLPDIVQLYVLSNTTGLLTVRRGTVHGSVWFEHGNIQHAVTATHEGEEAFYEIMMWSGGEFSMQLGESTADRSIAAHWQELLMESCRRLDEHLRSSSPAPASKRTGWTLAPPPLEAFSVPPQALELEETNDPKETTMNIKDSLTKLNQLDGFVGAALVDAESGMLLGQEGGGSLNLEVAAAGNTEVVRAKRKTITNLNLKDNIEDILITLGKQYHLIRPLRARGMLFFYVALDRNRANLAMARIALADVEKELVV